MGCTHSLGNLHLPQHRSQTDLPGSADKPWEVFVDSSLFNAPKSRSMGGYCALYPGSGVFGWRCFSPRKLGTSSGAAETIMASHAVHYIMGQRILDKELGIHTGGPTKLYTDNLATLQGTQMENVPTGQRYLSVRRHVLRQAAIEEKVVLLLKVATDDNPADMFTKPLEGAQFLKLRDIIMGCPDGPAASAPCATATAPDIECVQFLADLKADVWQENGISQSSQHTATCDVSSPRPRELRGDSLPPDPPEELCSDGKNAWEILGSGERWSENRPLVSGSIAGKSTTSIRVVD